MNILEKELKREWVINNARQISFMHMILFLLLIVSISFSWDHKHKRGNHRRYLNTASLVSYISYKSIPLKHFLLLYAPM
jgi:hypothetical protein